MWILHFLPDAVILWFTNLLLFAGVAITVAGFFIHRIPFPLIYQYQLPFKIVGVVLLVLGVYFRGGYAIEMSISHCPPGANLVSYRTISRSTY
jgi:hypothetical protein